MVFIFILFMFLISIIPISIGLIFGTVIRVFGSWLKHKRTNQLGRNIQISIDQYANVVLGGSPDETISSRTEKAKIKGLKWGIYLSKFLDLFEKGHTKKSLELDEGEDRTIKD